MPRKSKLTAEDEAKARELLLSGKSMTFVAGVLGCGVSSVQRVLQQLKAAGVIETRPGRPGGVDPNVPPVPSRKLTTEEKVEIVTRRAEGVSYRELAAEYDVPRDTIRDAVRKLVPHGNRHRPPVTPTVMPIAEFIETGYAQEINRRLLHVLGLDLAVRLDMRGQPVELVVMDHRGDPTGPVLGSALKTIEARQKAEYIRDEFVERSANRAVVLGEGIEPIETDRRHQRQPGVIDDGGRQPKIDFMPRVHRAGDNRE